MNNTKTTAGKTAFDRIINGKMIDDTFMLTDEQLGFLLRALRHFCNKTLSMDICIKLGNDPAVGCAYTFLTSEILKIEGNE